MKPPLKHRLAMFLFFILCLFSQPFSVKAGGGFQESARISAHAIAAEGDYVYILGDAVNLELSQQTASLNLGGGLKDIWLVKLNPEGTPVFSALIGGADDDSAFDLVVQQGVIYILGETWSTDFPGAPGSAGESDAVLLALAADGSQVLWSRRLGGSDQDAGRAMALQEDSLYITGITWSQDLVPGNVEGNADGFLGKFGLDGSLGWLKIFGGSALDAPFDLQVIQDDIWVAGQSFSRDFGSTHQGDGDAFATRFNLAGEVEFARLYGGSEADSAYAVYPFEEGGVVLAGGTRTGTLADAEGDYGGSYDGFLMHIDPGGDLSEVNYLGGTGVDTAHDLIQLPGGDMIVVGETYSPTFPLGYDSPQDTAGQRDAFIVRLSPDGERVSSWLKGGSEADFARGVILTDSGLWLAGRFNLDALSYALFMSSSELGAFTAPTPQPALPTATNAPTATPQPTETPLPTVTPTLLPTTPQTATSAAENTAAAGNLGATPTVSNEKTDLVSTIERTQTGEADSSPGVTEGAVSQQTTAANQNGADATIAGDTMDQAPENGGMAGQSTGLAVGMGILLAVGLGGAYYWIRQKKKQNSLEQ